MWHLLTHTSGLTYGFHHAHPVDAMYRAAGPRVGHPAGRRLRRGLPRSGPSMPLVFQPGSEWNYGVSTDVLGRLVEVVSGQPLDEFFEQRIFAPAGHDRHLVRAARDGDDVDSLARLYVAVAGPPGRRRRPGSTFREAFDAAARTQAGVPVRRRRAGLHRR